MALDGITISHIAWEINEKALLGRIDKIFQPEREEIIINIRAKGQNLKLLLTAAADRPRLHFTKSSKTNPMQAPLFCMVLRKHLSGGKLTKIIQPDFERILELRIEALNDMGDLAEKRLIIEIMGKHSNIILVDENGLILEAIKHVSHEKSSVREVLPGKAYEAPPSKGKRNPLLAERNDFLETLRLKENHKLQSMLYQSYSGISPLMAGEVCYRAGLDAGSFGQEICLEEGEGLFTAFHTSMESVRQGAYDGRIYYDSLGKPFEFSSLPLTMLRDNTCKPYDSISELLEDYYGDKDRFSRQIQKTADLRRLVNQHLERCVKKKELHLQTLEDTKNKEQLKLCGELITAYIHMVKKGMTVLTCQNFYDEDMPQTEVPLDPDLTPAENAQKYFSQYNKGKRTFAALQEQMIQNEQEIQYLESVLSTLTTSETEAELDEIRQELYEQGILHKRKADRQKQKKSKPLSYTSSDGFEIFVGKNNKQNDELTSGASPRDIWLHTKEIPGSHVIIKTNGQEVPDQTLLEAANLAAYYSKARQSGQVPVDYTPKKYVKKPNGAKPGFVIYETNKTVYVTPEEEKLIKEEIARV